jgi:cellulose synthase/poly-beta-1,6-N-acetylglucosamine synthase-like glycosyltransferase
VTAATALRALDWAVLGYFVLVNCQQTMLIAMAAVESRRHSHRSWQAPLPGLLSSSVTPRVSVLAPAHNEAATVTASVTALLTMRFPNLEIVLINDGSSDRTLDVLLETFELVPVPLAFDQRLPTKRVRGLYRSPRHPALVVLDKVNGGKADSLNAGLNVATGELVCAMDADTLIEPDGFLRIVQPFLDDDGVVAVGATIRAVNGSAVRQGRVSEVRAPRRLLPGIQAIEYLRAFLFGRLGWNRLGGNLIVSGAFGMFRRDAMIAAGGYRDDTVGEDMELVARLRRLGRESHGRHRASFVPDPIAWTEVPESVRVLGRQRDRWQRGLADVLWRHRRLLFNRSYGAMGLFVYPSFVVVELCGPIIEAVGLVGLLVALAIHAVNGPFAVLFFAVAYGWGVLLSVFALLLHQFIASRPFPARDVPKLLAYAVLENMGYRQLTVVWRLRGMWKYARGRRDWGVMTRSGFGTAT